VGLIVENRQALTRTIKAKAAELGFAKVGIARADALTEEGVRLHEWLARRYHGTMEWMERSIEKRVDPRLILPGAKSVISLAMNYYADVRHSNDPGVGKISRYAWGDDYHLVATPRIQSLLDCIKSENPDIDARIYVDTGPVMDKTWAVKSGIGWLGKHTNVITKEYGSWVFLGEIILDAELEYDEPIADFCGTCRACIDACPTGAIVEPYVLDSNKCISYLTIEHRGEIPGELRPKFENWVYGCDICQDVCPWNSFQQQTREEAFVPREVNVSPKLEELEHMTGEEFSRRFRRSPVKRTKLEGLRRNARAVLDGREP
jgi:epoxyqueuosine reductase